MNHQTTETKLEFALREQDKERTEKEQARYHLSKLLRASQPFCDGSKTWIAAHDYLYPPVVKGPYANDEGGEDLR